MKNATHFRNRFILEQNKTVIAKYELDSTQRVNAIKKQIAELELKITQEKINNTNRCSSLVAANKSIETKGFQAFNAKVEVMLNELGLTKHSIREKVIGLLRTATAAKSSALIPEFFYFCTTDPSKSTFRAPDRMQHFIKVNMETLEVFNRIKKIDNLLQDV